MPPPLFLGTVMAENEFTCRTWRYGPNGEARIFTDSRDVPKDWLDHPMKFSNPHYPHDAPVEDNSSVTQPDGPVAEAADDAPLPITRAEIIRHLKERNITFRFTAKTDVLYALLLSAIEREDLE